MDDREQPSVTTINLLWINNEIGEDFVTIFPPASFESITTRIRQWALEWTYVVVWYDGVTPLTYVQNTREYFDGVSNVHFQNIRSIGIIQGCQDVFRGNVPLYFKVDLLKLMLAYSHLVKARKPTYFVYADLGVVPKPHSVLLDQKTKETVERIGFVVATKGAIFQHDVFPMLSFFVFSNYSGAWLNVVKSKLIALNIARVRHVLSGGSWNGGSNGNLNYLSNVIHKDLINAIKYYYSRRDWAEEKEVQTYIPFGLTTMYNVQLDSFSQEATDNDGVFEKNGLANMNARLFLPLKLVRLTSIRFNVTRQGFDNPLNGIRPSNIHLRVNDEIRLIQQGVTLSNGELKDFSAEIMFLVIRNNYEDLARQIVDSLTAEQLEKACTKKNKEYMITLLNNSPMIPFEVAFVDDRANIVAMILDKLREDTNKMDTLVGIMIDFPKKQFVTSFESIRVFMNEEGFGGTREHKEALHRLASCLFGIARVARDDEPDEIVHLPLSGETTSFLVDELLPIIADLDPGEESVFETQKADMLVLNAVRCRCYAVVEYLSDQNVSDIFSTSDANGVFPLMFVCRYPEDFDKFKMIFQANPEMLTERNRFKETVAHHAVLYDNENVIKFLFEVAPELFKSKDERGRTPLMTAADPEVSLETFKLVWEKFPDTDRYKSKQEFSSVWSIALYAVIARNIEVVKYFVQVAPKMIVRDYLEMRGLAYRTSIDIYHYLVSLNINIQEEEEEDNSDSDY